MGKSIYLASLRLLGVFALLRLCVIDSPSIESFHLQNIPFPKRVVLP